MTCHLHDFLLFLVVILCWFTNSNIGGDDWCAVTWHGVYQHRVGHASTATLAMQVGHDDCTAATEAAESARTRGQHHYKQRDERKYDRSNTQRAPNLRHRAQDEGLETIHIEVFDLHAHAASSSRVIRGPHQLPFRFDAPLPRERHRTRGAAPLVRLTFFAFFVFYNVHWNINRVLYFGFLLFKWSFSWHFS